VVAKLVGEIVEGPTNAMQLVKQFQNRNHRLGNFKSTKKSVKFTSQKSEPKDFIPLILEDVKLTKLLNRIIEWQRNEKISVHEGFPEYILEYIAKEIEPDQSQRNILIRKLYRLEKITRFSSGNVFVEE
jgi:hypothetical protein